MVGEVPRVQPNGSVLAGEGEVAPGYQGEGAGRGRT